jgi:hypothetical protein
MWTRSLRQKRLARAAGAGCGGSLARADIAVKVQAYWHGAKAGRQNITALNQRNVAAHSGTIAARGRLATDRRTITVVTEHSL